MMLRLGGKSLGAGGQRTVRERSRKRKRWQWKATKVKAVEKEACVGPKGHRRERSTGVMARGRVGRGVGLWRS